MKKGILLCSVALAAFLMGGAAFAKAPEHMAVDNNTYLISNAYMHDIASSAPLGPKSSETIPWTTITALCHGTSSLLKSSDSCAFDVYATSDAANPKQIHVATVTMYLSDGKVVNIAQLGAQYGLKVVAVAPGKFELNNV